MDNDNPKAPNWGTKVDHHGNKKRWFGWKLHIGADSLSDMPVSFQLTAANCYDSPEALPIIHTYHTLCEKNRFSKPGYFSLDKAYDAVEIYETVRQEYGAQAIIPINPRKAKEPPAGYYDFNGTPACSAGYPMVYWGHDKNSNKFRCPHVIGKVDCPFGTAWCTNSNYGAVVKTRPSKDPRYVSLPHRGSKKWKEQYNLRSSVERCFGRLKENFNLDNIRAKGYEGAKTHVLLSMISLLAAKLAVEAMNQEMKAA